jgi:hypothetical protein
MRCTVGYMSCTHTQRSKDAHGVAEAAGYCLLLACSCRLQVIGTHVHISSSPPERQ